MPEHPVFYASNNFETAVQETIEEEGEMMLVSLWISEPMAVKYLKFLSPSNADGYLAHQRDEIEKDINKLPALVADWITRAYLGAG